MTTQNKENYGRDVRNFHHPEDDMKPVSDITNQDLVNQSYADEYEKGNDDDEEILNQDDDIVNNEDEGVNNFYENESDDIASNDIDDDLEEDYDENDRDINDFTTENTNKDLLDLEYDIDQDLEETDPVNHPRNFQY
ncbi:hypothetical protein [Flavobacterium limi]|uniref:Uncharacterized protein n=1 Tax=Flavobacterium limi TaxID=2045105 RepID=A0ABQ1TWR8_9FLAO|nr:hypothetical protein [Flavobacterium limi]GGF03080.1 hypothetical protein GCM10011518_10370 [Flavobacterium limi]